MKFSLTEKHQLNEKVWSFAFKPEQCFNFIPGQFTMLKKIGDASKNSRAFSMACAPNCNSVIFIMKHISGGQISDYLVSAEIGSEIEASPAFGRFTLDQTDSDRVFVATGTGLAPIMSFIEDGAKHSTLLFGVSDKKSLFWKDKLPKNSLITFSQERAHDSFLHGRITDYIPCIAEQHKTAAWYLCGNTEMIKDARTQLITAGIPIAKIHFEIF